VSDDDGGVGASQATVVVIGLQGFVGEMDQGVNDLQASGRLSPPSANFLSASLDAAVAKLDAGDLDGAIHSLEVFINKVEGLLKTGRLTARDAAPLLEEARRLIRVIRVLQAG
jgi:hypothetical protein